MPGAWSWLGTGELPSLEFAVRNRPYLTAVSAPGRNAPGIQDAALRDVADAALRAIRAGATGSQIRRVIELAIVLPVIMATGAQFPAGGGVVSVADRWHLVHPEPGARKCSKHRKVPSAEHEIGLRWQVRGTDGDRKPVKRNFESEEEAKDFDAELKAAVRAGQVRGRTRREGDAPVEVRVVGQHPRA